MEGLRRLECLYLSAIGSKSIALQTFGESDTGTSNPAGPGELASVKGANALLVAGLRTSDLLGKEGMGGSVATVSIGSGAP